MDRKSINENPYSLIGYTVWVADNVYEANAPIIYRDESDPAVQYLMRAKTVRLYVAEPHNFEIWKKPISWAAHEYDPTWIIGLLTDMSAKEDGFYPCRFDEIENLDSDDPKRKTVQKVFEPMYMRFAKRFR